MSSVSPSFYDPYNHISYVELNKRNYGEIVRDESEKLENRSTKPAVKRIFLKRNGDPKNKKSKLFIWRQWQSPTLKLLLEEAGTFMDVPDARNIYDDHGHRIDSEHDIHDGKAYYVVGDETFEIFDGDQDFRVRAASVRPPDRGANTSKKKITSPRPRTLEPRRQSRVSLYSDYSDLIDYDYDKEIQRTRSARPATRRGSFYDDERDYGIPPRPVSLDDISAYEHYNYDETPRKATAYHPKSPTQDYSYGHYDYGYGDSPRRSYAKTPAATRSYSAPTAKRKKRTARTVIGSAYGGRYSPTRPYSVGKDPMYSEFDDPDAMAKDRAAIDKHKAKLAKWRRTQSGVIYNRRDQTHPDAYIIYVFLNGQGMNCQHINFQRKQLEKGMNYVLELIARRFNVNPGKLCNMDGKKMQAVQDLMSRGAYVLVPVGQSFRDQWYFLPDNAIDTSTNIDRIRERSAQRDRLIQRREKREATKNKKKKTATTIRRSRSALTLNGRTLGIY